MSDVGTDARIGDNARSNPDELHRSVNSARSGANNARRNTSKTRRSSNKARWITPIIVIVAVLALWQAACSLGIIPTYMIPSPIDVCIALVRDAELLSMHSWVTLCEALAGLGLGIAIGFVIAMLMDRFRLVNAALSPLVTISQTIPTVAIAPLLVLWLGYGMLPKIVLVALTTFFPITVSLAQGFKSVDRDTTDLMRTMGASWWQTFRFVKLRSSAASFFSGLKISATYAIVGAVIAEWLGGFNGLGVYMTRVRKSYAYDEMFASILIICVLSLALMGVVALLERICMPWRRKSRSVKVE